MNSTMAEIEARGRALAKKIKDERLNTQEMRDRVIADTEWDDLGVNLRMRFCDLFMQSIYIDDVFADIELVDEAKDLFSEGELNRQGAADCIIFCIKAAVRDAAAKRYEAIRGELLLNIKLTGEE